MLPTTINKKVLLLLTMSVMTPLVAAMHLNGRARAASSSSSSGSSSSESDVGFPERENLDIERNNTRVPLYIPGKCPPNQLFFPGNQKNDWICDCKPGYLYYAAMDGCYEAYRQGPCPAGEYLLLPAGDFSPRCVANPCRQDGLAPYNERCYALYKEGGPCQLEAGAGIFGVNTATLRVECIRGIDRLSMMPPTPPSTSPAPTLAPTRRTTLRPRRKLQQ